MHLQQQHHLHHHHHHDHHHQVPHNFPPPVKWLFDILDDAAVQHGMNSAEVDIDDDNDVLA